MQKYMLNHIKRDSRILENIIMIIIFIMLNITTIFSYAPYSSDESGYLAQAALLAGENWSEVAQQLSYFSFGNGILVFWLFKLGMSRLLLYRLLLIINSVMLCITYKICIYILKELFRDVKDVNAILVSLIVTIHPRNFCSSNLYIAESYITFVFWVMLFLLVKFYISQKKIWLLFFSVLNVYIFFIHQRTMLISLTGLIVLICGVLLNSREDKKMIKRLAYCGMILLLAVFVFMLLYLYKKYCKSMIWPQSLQKDMVNDFSSTPSEYLNKLRSPEFVLELLKSFAGKVWYLITGTLGFVVVGLCYLCKALFVKIKEKDYLSMIIPIFLIGSFGGSLLIAAYWQVYPWRIDQIPYGRYMEVLIGPYIMFGIVSFLSGYEKYNVKYWLPIMIILGKVAEIYAGEVLERTSVNELNATPVIRYLLINPYVSGEYLKITILFAGIIVIIDRVITKRKEMISLFLIVLYLIPDVAIQYERIQNNLDNYLIINDVCETMDDSKKRLGYTSINIYANELQFVNPEWEFIRFGSYESIKELENIDYLLLTSSQYKDFLKSDSNNEKFIVSFENETITVIQMN